MLDFKKLKASNSLEKLQKAVEEEQKKKSFGGDNPDEYWAPKRDKAGNGTAKIRFLPAPPMDGEEGLPWVKWWRYNFQGPGGWYINNSLATLEKADPCAEYNSRLWATKNEDNIAQAKKQNRIQTICANVKILEDKLQPEFEGKVRKFKFGVKIWNKIDAAMKGDEDNPAYDPFCFWEGADFRLKVKTIKIPGQKDQPNYDDSAFLARAPLSKDAKELEEIWNQEFSLKALVAPSEFKSYEDLLKDLTRVIGFDPTTLNLPAFKSDTPRETVKPKVEEDDTPPWNTSEDNSDDLLSKFKDLTDD